jgi:hypothetical protein
MDTGRVNICYRPLRVCWAIADGDAGAFRKAVRLPHTMWGGRFDRIVIAGDPTQRASGAVLCIEYQAQFSGRSRDGPGKEIDVDSPNRRAQ